jgi:hypothetical protein
VPFGLSTHFRPFNAIPDFWWSNYRLCYVFTKERSDFFGRWDGLVEEEEKRERERNGFSTSNVFLRFLQLVAHFSELI